MGRHTERDYREELVLEARELISRDRSQGIDDAMDEEWCLKYLEAEGLDEMLETRLDQLRLIVNK